MDLLNTLMLVIVAIIAVVIAHGFYRKWCDRRNRVVIKLERNIPQADIDLELLPNSELPNGGARSIPRETEPVIPRKRYQLKDGRDKVRSNTPEPENVPVLMDPLDIEETAIEHANVFVTADTSAQETAATFADEELPPEVMAGLDEEFHDTPPATAAAAGAGAHTIDETGLDDEHDHAGDDDDADEYIAAKAEPLAADDEFDEGFSEQFDGEFEEEVIDEQNAEPATVALEADGQAVDGHEAELASDDERAENSVTDTEYEDEEEYDPYEDENFYENEPALLENAYKLATSRFHRHQEPEAPRIEPGFGEAAGEEVETSEEFAAALNEDAMDEFLDKEQEEIRAWRNQSVTQQDAPPVAPVPKPAVAVRPIESLPASVATRFDAASPSRAAPPIEPVVPTGIDEAQVPPSASVQPPEPKASPKPAAPAKDHKPGFWQAMTGMTAKSAKVAPPKIAQGELFHGESAAAPQPATPGALTGPQEVVVVNVMAKPGFYFYGDEMLPVLQHYGLRLGQMNIFHRHTEVDGTGPVMFSMANMVKPGTFALNGIENFATPGVSFFVQLPNRHGNMKAFEHMLATANGVKQALDGILKDERRSVLTRQTVEHCRQRIRDFELSLLAKK